MQQGEVYTPVGGHNQKNFTNRYSHHENKTRQSATLPRNYYLLFDDGLRRNAFPKLIVFLKVGVKVGNYLLYSYDGDSQTNVCMINRFKLTG